MRFGRSSFIATGAAWILLCTSSLADDNYVHAFTGFSFPSQVGDFTRMRVTPYNTVRSDIEVDYDNKPYTVHASVYVYPAHDPLERHYMKCKSDVLQVHPDALILGEKPVALTESGVKYEGFSALYTFHASFVNATPQDLLSMLWVFRRGDFYVLYRISYAASDKEAAERQIADFIKRLEWPSEKAGPASP